MNPRRVVRPSRPVYSRGSTNIRRSFRLPAWNWRLVGTVSGAVILVVAWSMTFSVQQVVVTGAGSVPRERLVREAQDEIRQHLGWGNLTLLDTDALASRIKQREPLLSGVTVLRTWPHTVTVKVEERTPGMIWATGEQRYLIDSEGVVVGAAGQGSTSLATVVDSTNLSVKVGDRVVASSFISYIAELRTLMPATKLGIKSLQVPETTTEVFVTTDRGYVVKFDTTRSAASGVQALVRVQAELARVGKTPAEYIDLRIENRAYYK